MSRICTVTIASLLVIIAGGCATNKRVQANLDPLNKRIGGLESKSKQVDGTLSDLERGVGRADERAQGALGKADEAARAAMRANEAAAKANEEALKSGNKADTAGTDAANAKSLAEQGLGKTGELADRLAGLDNFKLAGQETVLFALGQSALTAEAKAVLDRAAATTKGKTRFAVEVQGFTDSTGNAALNLELSQRRAQAVVRYLTLEHKVPLRRISVLGMGSAQPVSDNKTSAERKLNRRVEVRFYTAEPDAPKASAAASAR